MLRVLFAANRCHICPGDVFPPGMIAQLVSSVFSAIFMIGIAFMFVGDALFATLQFPRGTQLVRLMKENQGYSFRRTIYMLLCSRTTVMVLMAFNMISAQLIATGAFEVLRDPFS